MKKTSNKIIFFGNERLATGVTTTAPTLSGLIEAGYEIAAVVSNYERGRSRSARELEIADVAKKHCIPVLLPDRPIDIIEELADIGAEAGILVAYGRIVHQKIIDIFPKGIINIHPSLLPLHRGPTPIESVILEGAAKTGVSLMSLVKKMDAGPVYARAEIKLRGDESKQELADTLLEIGGAMLTELLPDILDGTVVAVPQDDSGATYNQLLTTGNGTVDWAKPAAQIEREIRAFADWPKSRATIAGKDVIITKAHVAESEIHGTDIKNGQAYPAPGGFIGVATAKGDLIIENLKPAGKKEMTAAEFLRGYGHKLS